MTKEHAYAYEAGYVDGSTHLQEAEAENAKLQELVKSMYYALTHMTFPPDWVTDYEADMRDLGIEVSR